MVFWRSRRSAGGILRARLHGFGFTRAAVGAAAVVGRTTHAEWRNAKINVGRLRTIRCARCWAYALADGWRTSLQCGGHRHVAAFALRLVHRRFDARSAGAAGDGGIGP